MRLLPLPDCTGVEGDLQTALADPPGITRAELDELLAKFERYLDEGGEPADWARSAELDQDLLNRLHDAYPKTRGGILKHVRRALLREGELCPICEIDEARELDHFLPKNVYRAFSIYPANLVPLCPRCNRAKATYASGGALKLIHSYLDPIPDGPILRADVAVEGEALVVDFVVDPGRVPDATLRKRIERHEERVKLKRRRDQAIVAYLRHHVPAFKLAREAQGHKGVRRFLRRQARHETRLTHPGDWRVVLLHALSTHEPFWRKGWKRVLKRRDPRVR